MLATLLWIAAVILVIVGIIRLVKRDYLLGAVLIVVGLVVGPGFGLNVG